MGTKILYLISIKQTLNHINKKKTLSDCHFCIKILWLEED